ncbi:MAG: isoquinoline 1-oxidoreductase [Planctomycetota bacterium]|nr:MAG: isoquinoline 1-oxidoreductase [Planctomycetota bacterium]
MLRNSDNASILDGEPNEVERYELREGPAYRFDANRREFIEVLGAGLVIAVAARGAVAQRQRGGRGGRGPRAAVKAGQRFYVGKDGIVTVMSSKVEVGQGSRTQIAQAAAEELHLPLDRVRVILADTAVCPDDGGTAGSRTTPSTVPAVRAASAALREVLTAMAAKRLEADADAVRFDGGEFVAAKKKISLGELAAADDFAAQLDATVLGNATVTPVESWTVLGKPAAKVGGDEIVTGRHRYPSDIVRPGMLYGKVLRPPALGAKLESVDATAAKKLEGVVVVTDGDFAGCAAANSALAAKGVDALAESAQWQLPKDAPTSDNVYDHFERTAASSGRGRPNTWGDTEKAFAAAEKKIDVAYTIAYIQHAPMEPRAAVAEWNDGKLTVWTGTQQPSRVRGELAAAFRIAEADVRVVVPDTGGGFGGKHSGEAAVEAARLAKAAGKPVSLRWTREEECTWAYCRPGGLIEVRAALDERGKLAAWDFTNYNSGGSAIDSPYQSASGRTRFVAADSPLRQGSYRALASTANTFARESAMDELALLSGADPLEFRLAHLPAGRLKDVLVAAAKRFDWPRRRKETTAPRGVGLACGTEKGSFVAACAEVEMIDGQPKVLSICQAYECGAIQNPLNLRMQVAGCIVMGLGGALFEEVKFQDAKITNASFSDYRVPRMSDVPQIDIELVNRHDLPSVGAGETPIIAVAPAIANAIVHAGCGRIRSMPLSRGRG